MTWCLETGIVLNMRKAVYKQTNKSKDMAMLISAKSFTVT